MDRTKKKNPQGPATVPAWSYVSATVEPELRYCTVISDPVGKEGAESEAGG